jgi:hypothetical protein
VRLLREGLDAMETRFFAFRGKVRDTRQVINFAERRAYIELAMEYGGYHQKEKPIEASQPPWRGFPVVLEHIGSQKELVADHAGYP